MQIIVILQFHGLPYKVLLRNRYTCGRMVKLGGARKPFIIGIPGRMVKLEGGKAYYYRYTWKNGKVRGCEKAFYSNCRIEFYSFAKNDQL